MLAGVSGLYDLQLRRALRFTIHFGPLFLPWVAGDIGLSTYALLGGAATLDTAAAPKWFAGQVLALTGWVLVVLAAFFALLWLSEIVPDLIGGNPSRSALDYKVPTNPVHVLDLAVGSPGRFRQRLHAATTPPARLRLGSRSPGVSRAHLRPHRADTLGR